MKKVWVKETRNENGNYIRINDWFIPVKDEFSKSNFTEIKPPIKALELNIACDWNVALDNWVLDLENYKTYKITQMKQACTLEMQTGTITHIFEDESNITIEATYNKQINLMSLKLGYDSHWFIGPDTIKDIEDKVHVLSSDKIIELLKALTLAGKALFNKLNSKINQINIATTEKQIENIIWE